MPIYSVSDNPEEDLEAYAKSFENSSLERIRRHIDQEYEMAGLARQDNDLADSARRLKRIARLRQLMRESA